MTIKLIRTDAEDPCKIQLPLGEHVIGRGKLLEVSYFIHFTTVIHHISLHCDSLGP